MEIEPNIFDQLAEPFPPEVVHWRVGSTTKDKDRGIALAYIDARDAADRLNAIVGPENWQDRYINSGNGATCCEVGIKYEGEWIWKSDGAGQTDYEGDKGQFSDAFKRACVKWGIARYLYDLPAPWVAIEPMGRSYKIADSAKADLDKALIAVAQRLEWGDRNHQNLFRMLKQAITTFCTSKEMSAEFVEANRGVLRQLPVKLQRELKAELERMADRFNAVAAE